MCIRDSVTEDADIGIRLKQKNYHIVMMESETAEEAVISVGNWIHQRSRWIKGFIQTFLVHSKNLAGFIRASGIIGFTGFILFIGMPVLIFLSIPFLLILGCAALWFNADMPSFLLPMMWGNLSLVIVISLVNPVLSLIHISERTRLAMISYAVFGLKKKRGGVG